MGVRKSHAQPPVPGQGRQPSLETQAKYVITGPESFVVGFGVGLGVRVRVGVPVLVTVRVGVIVGVSVAVRVAV